MAAATRRKIAPARKKQKKRAKTRKPAQSHSQDRVCPIVGIGGSAGGFEATMELVRNLPEKTGIAFVIVQHLDPHHASRLPVLLGKVSSMPVASLHGKMIATPNTIYVQPPNKCLMLKDGAFTLIPRKETLNLTIDHFFESMAKELGPRAIGVVLSGTGTDGTAGLRAIKAAGGLTFAQSLSSAKFDAMPRNAIRSGVVDAELSPREIAHEIHHVNEHSYIRRPFALATDAAGAQEGDLNQIFTALKKQIGVDFSHYKRTTLLRRIQRRMALLRIEELPEYTRFLHDNRKEIEALFNDLLINVTHFFRDEPVFRVLQQRVLPALLRTKKKDRHPQLRIWVPGCATGEEVYSLVICILETLGKNAAKIDIQVFGTDLSESTIEHARAGAYSPGIKKHVSPSRLKRFFTERDGTYQINRSVRELCTFARQNIAADPPFSRLDVISCRNVLIYLGPELHKRCIPQFHYALHPGGCLILGPAESLGVYDDLFEAVDRKNKIYKKKDVPTPRYAEFIAHRGYEFPARLVSASQSVFNEQLLQMADSIMLRAYAPAAVIIDDAMRVEQFRGRADEYLERPPEEGTRNFLQLVHPSMVADLRTAIDRATRTGKPVRKERALIRFGGKAREVNIEIVPFKVAASADKSWLLVIFDETTHGTRPGKVLHAIGKTTGQRHFSELQRELKTTTAVGQEMSSRNEELQLMNEELETAKEELQSTNEELTTLNDELSNRNLEMMQVTGDLDNLLASVQFPIVMVDNTLTVRRATPAARDAFNILPTDVGRRITDLRPNIDLPDLEDLLLEVIGTLNTRERKVTDRKGRRYSLRVRPYRTSDNRIDGAVLTLVDTGEIRKRRSK